MNKTIRMVACGFMALLATALVGGVALAQTAASTGTKGALPAARSTNTYLLPNENLKTYKARMEKYFAARIASQGLGDLVEKEGGEYNEYIKFMRYWEPRLYPDGDFKRYFDLERNFYRQRGGRGVVVAPNLKKFANARIASGSVGTLSGIGSNPWQGIGPIAKPPSHVGAEGTGPMDFITFYNPSPSHMLSGSNAGGLFYSTNSGVTWSKTGTDTEIGRSGVGTAVFHPNDYKTWFAGSAGNSGGSDPSWIGYTGGVFRTSDEGATWSQIADQAQLGGIWSQIFKLAINPNNPNQLWAATSNGLFQTNNALATIPTWTAVPALLGKYVFDVEFRPGNTAWMYATAADWTSNGPANWSYKYSSNNGSTWQDVPGQPATTSSAFRLVIEVSPAKADNLYCLTIQPGGSGALSIYDFGLNQWNLVYGSVYITAGGGQAFAVNSFNSKEIFLSQTTEGRRYTYQGTPLYIDYHSSYYTGGTYHPDIEYLVSHPINPNEVWMCTHGGNYVSTNNGLTWADRSTGLGVAQVNSMATSASDPSYVALGLYHDGTIGTKSQWYPLWSPTWSEYPGSFCDGMRPMIDPTNPQYIWQSCQGGGWTHSTDGGVTFSSNGPPSPAFVVEAAFNHINPQTQYRITMDTGNHLTVKRTFDRGNNWTQIADFQALYPAANFDYLLWNAYTSETNGDYLLVHLLARPVGSQWWTGNHLYRTKIANDPNAANVIASWEELPLPENRWLAGVKFDPTNPDIVYIANSSSSNLTSSMTGTGMVFKVDYTNPAAHTYNVCTSGVCWDLTQNLPNATTGQDPLAVEQGSNGGLYFASDFGVWYSNNATRALGGTGWTLFGGGLPNTTHNGIEINYVNNKVRVGSFGRGAWEADLQTGCTEPPPGLALWLPLDEAAGSAALNAVPLSLPGTHAGGPTPLGSGKVAGALCFDGVDDHVDVPSYAAVNFSTFDFSLDLWVRRNLGASGTEVLIDKRTDPGAQVRGYSLFLYNGQIGLQLADGTYANYLSQATVPADGLWHHVAVTVKRGNPAGGLFYLDGKQAGLAFNPTGHPGTLSTSAPFRVGARSALSSSGPVSAVLHGCLDEVEAFRRVLSSDEILAIYRAGANGKCKLSCSLPTIASYCGTATTVTVAARICNYTSQPQVFNYSFQGLPAQSGCSQPGPLNFTPAFGQITVPAGQCQGIQIVIGRPLAMNTIGMTGCYQLLVQVPATQETFSCGGTVDVRNKFCDDILPPN